MLNKVSSILIKVKRYNEKEKDEDITGNKKKLEKVRNIWTAYPNPNIFNVYFEVHPQRTQVEDLCIKYSWELK